MPTEEEEEEVKAVVYFCSKESFVIKLLCCYQITEEVYFDNL